MTNTTAELETRIEQMVAEHVAAVRKAAQAAVERAFSGASASVAAPTVARSRPRVAQAASKRRTGTELSALGERFFEALSRKPGETMAVLSGGGRRVACGATASGRSIEGGESGPDHR
jgi:phage shock protein A